MAVKPATVGGKIFRGNRQAKRGPAKLFVNGHGKPVAVEGQAQRARKKCHAFGDVVPPKRHYPPEKGDFGSSVFECGGDGEPKRAGADDSELLGNGFRPHKSSARGLSVLTSIVVTVGRTVQVDGLEWQLR